MLSPIKDFISQGKLAEAIDALLNIENLGFEQEKRIRLEAANYSQYKIEKRNGTTDNSTLKASRNRIILGLLEVVNTLEQKTIKTEKSERSTISLYLLTGVFGGCLVLLGLIAWHWQGNPSIENEPIPVETPLENQKSTAETKELTQKTSKADKRLSFQIVPYSKELITLLAENKELVFKASAADVVIKLTYSGDLITTNEQASLYRYKGGVLIIQIGDEKICPIESLKIEASEFDFGNPEDHELKQLDRQIQSHLEHNPRLIAEQIAQCLKK